MKFFLVEDTGEDVQGLPPFAQNCAGSCRSLLKRCDAGRHLYGEFRIKTFQRTHEIAEGTVDKGISQCKKGCIFAAIEHFERQPGIVVPGFFQNFPVAGHGKVQAECFHIFPKMGACDGQRNGLLVARRGGREDDIHFFQTLNRLERQQIRISGTYSDTKECSSGSAGRRNVHLFSLY